MPKRVFWPAALVIMGLILMASNMGYLPAVFWDFWPVMLIIVGLAGLLISDREQWMSTGHHSAPARKSKPAAKKRKR